MRSTQKGPFCVICGQRRPWSACTAAQADLGRRLLTETMDTVVYFDEQRMLRLDCRNAHPDQDLRCCQNGIRALFMYCASHDVAFRQYIIAYIFFPIQRTETESHRERSRSPTTPQLTSTEHLMRMKNIIFLDLDNFSGFFSKLPRRLPDLTFIWGFYGGKIVWREPDRFVHF